VFMCYNPECMRDSCRFDITWSFTQNWIPMFIQT
jgi:hypothetical protein